MGWNPTVRCPTSLRCTTSWHRSRVRRPRCAGRVVLPELVKKLPGWIDAQPVEDLRMMDNTNLIYVAINAIKELKAINDALTARIAALEAASGA